MLLGDWYLYSAETEGSVEYYDENSDQFMIITFFDDETVLLTEYYKGEVSFRMNELIYYNTEGQPCFDYDDKDGLPEIIDYETYTVTEISGDGSEITVYIDFYNYDEGWLGGYTLVLTR